MREMKILYTNTDQLTDLKKYELESMVLCKKPRLIALCEVKPKNGEVRHLVEYEMKDYSVCNHTNINNNEGRGIIILAHSSIRNQIVDIQCTSNFEEVFLIKVRLLENNTLVFGCFYRSPSQSESFLNNNNHLNKLLRSQDHPT